MFIPKSEERYAIADMITGYGVCESVVHFHSIFKKEDLVNKKIIIQGWGNVASAAAFYLARKGAKIVGIIDRDGGIINKNGLTLEEIEYLFIHKNGNKLSSPDMKPFEETNDNIWDIDVDIFIPGAAAKIVSMSQVERMMKNGLETISCGANVPFVDDKVFFGETADTIDKKISLIPDFVANCGMARVFAYLMQKDVEVTDRAIFSDVSEVIKNYLLRLYEQNTKATDISTRSLLMSIEYDI
jgi:glutamate dehydrogenase/leucine dehydrogenase